MSKENILNPTGCEDKRLAKAEDKHKDDNFSIFDPDQILGRNEELKENPNIAEKNQLNLEANLQIQAEEAIREGSFEHFMQKQLNMKNIYASSVNIIENSQDSLELNNYIEAKDFFEIPLEENIDSSYANHYNEVIRMIQNNENKFENFDTIRENFSLCKSTIKQSTLPSLYKNLICLTKSQDPTRTVILSQIKLLHIIIKNIDLNLNLL